MGEEKYTDEDGTTKDSRAEMPACAGIPLWTRISGPDNVMRMDKMEDEQLTADNFSIETFCHMDHSSKE
jgi:hypothetical protein